MILQGLLPDLGSATELKVLNDKELGEKAGRVANFRLVISKDMKDVAIRVGGLCDLDVSAIAFVTYKELIERNWSQGQAYHMSYLLAWAFQDKPLLFSQEFEPYIKYTDELLGTLEYLPEENRDLPFEFMLGSGSIDNEKAARLEMFKKKVKFSEELDETLEDEDPNEAGVSAYLRKGPTLAFKSFLRKKFLNEDFHVNAQVAAKYLLEGMTYIMSGYLDLEDVSPAMECFYGNWSVEPVIDSAFMCIEVIADEKEALKEIEKAEADLKEQDIEKEPIIDSPVIPITVKMPYAECAPIKSKEKFKALISMALFMNLMWDGNALSQIGKAVNTYGGKRPVLFVLTNPYTDKAYDYYKFPVCGPDILKVSDQGSLLNMQVNKHLMKVPDGRLEKMPRERYRQIKQRLKEQVKNGAQLINVKELMK